MTENEILAIWERYDNDDPTVTQEEVNALLEYLEEQGLLPSWGD